jgi:hypothetical protein
MVRWEANHAKNKRQCARQQKERLKGIACATAKARGGGGGETPSKTEYSRDAKEDEDEGEIIFPRSPLHETLLSPGEIFAWQMGVPASAHRAKCPKWMPAGVQPVIVAWPHSGMFCPAGNMCLLH